VNVDELNTTPAGAYDPDPAAARRAALYVVSRLPKHAAVEVLAMLGLIPSPTLSAPYRDSLGRATEPAAQRARRDTDGRYT